MIDETDTRERLARIETMTEHISRDMHSIQAILGRMDGRMHRVEGDIIGLHNQQRMNIQRITRLEAEAGEAGDLALRVHRGHDVRRRRRTYRRRGGRRSHWLVEIAPYVTVFTATVTFSLIVLAAIV